VQQLDHALELPEHGSRALLLRGFRRIRLVRREKVEGVVAPVVGQALLDQPLFGGEGVHGQQLDARHAEVGEVTDRRRVREPGVAAAQVLGHTPVELRHALDVCLVDHGFVEGYVRLGYAAPVEVVVDNNRAKLAGGDTHHSPGVRLDQKS
jgi:hypothetical protein